MQTQYLVTRENINEKGKCIFSTSQIVETIEEALDLHKEWSKRKLEKCPPNRGAHHVISIWAQIKS